MYSVEARKLSGCAAFSHSAQATVTLPGSYSLTVYDAAGRLVSSLFRGRLEPGAQFWTWDRTSPSGRRIPAGTFFVRLRGPGTCLTRRLVLL